MASAKFLEEALTTDVDESAVNAIVGSLETSLVNSNPVPSNQSGISVNVSQNHLSSAVSNGSLVSSQKHGALNGGPDSMNIILNSDASKVISCSNHQSGVSSVVNTVVTPMHGNVSSSGYINQVSSNIGLVQSNLTNLGKVQDTVKLVYPSSTQSATATVGGVNRVSYPNTQTLSSLSNGNIGLTALTSHSNLNVSSASIQSATSLNYSHPGANVNKQVSGVGVVGMDQSKPTGTALVIKASGNNHGPQAVPLTQGVVSVPMTVNTTMTLTGSGTHVNTALGATTTSNVPGVVTLTKPISQSVGSQQGVVGNNPTIIPANVQIVNVNTIRTGTPVQPGQKAAPPRVMTIGTPQMVGARPGQPGQQITLQTLQSLQGAQGGHLLLKTENGQYQLLRVGPAQTPTAAIAPNNATNTAAFRVQSVPVGGTAAATVQTQVPALTTQATTPTATTPQRTQSADTVKEKCRKFLANLLELSSREPKAVERNVRNLIQELVDTKVEPEEFCDRLERLLNASPQPCLIGFLKKSLPLLRQSMVTKELVIDGIRPPPASVLYSAAQSPIVHQTVQQGVTRVTTHGRGPRVRVITQTAPTSVAGTPTRPAQSVQHRIVTPMRVPAPGAKVASGTPIVGLRPQTPITGNTAIRLQTPIRTAIAKPGQATVPLTMKAQPVTTTLKPGQMLAKATIATRPVTPLNTSALKQPPNSGLAPSILLKAVTAGKEKEKSKSFSSAGYTGDDDINDVAAMGGVNLAEETQRILGSTEFVGTQIRSCKDDLYLYSTPLMKKISQIVAKHGLEEPSSEVAALISHATQERLKNLVEKLAVIAEHRIDMNKLDTRYEVTQDVRGQLKFLEELDRVETRRHAENERELLLRAAKSRSKSEDPEQAKLKAKAKEMQRAEMEELRQREANLTALQAIGPRKKPRLDGSDGFPMPGQASSSSSSPNNSSNRSQTLRPRLKRVNIRDLLFLLETEKETCHSKLLYKAYLK